MDPATNIDEQERLPARLPRGFEVSGYVVDGWLRDGGMAAIYRARRTQDDRRVALKLQLSSTAQDLMIRARFDREAQVMRRAKRSPHVVELYDAGVLSDGRRYFAMEWVEGENLEELLDFLRNQDQRLPIARACRIGRDVARGLAELHEHGVLHLDLKPANVMVTQADDGRDEIKLVDFGVAADLHEESAHELHAVPMMGTSGYMPPEQLHGEPPSPSFDVYAFGVLMFESLAGRSVPPDGWTPETLPRVETLRRGLPKPLADLVHACMDFDPARRPASPHAVAAELVRIILAIEAEARRGGRKVNATPEPVRTGRTEVVPRLTVAGGSARTGGTEVVLRSEVMAEVPRADEAIPRSEEPSEAEASLAADSAACESAETPQSPGPVVPQEIETLQSVDSVESSDAEVSGDACSVDASDDEGVPRSRSWARWAMLGGVAAVVAAAWIGWDNGGGHGTSGGAGQEPRTGAAPVTARSVPTTRGPEAKRDSSQPAPAVAARKLASTHRRSVAARPQVGPGRAATGAEACRKARTDIDEAKWHRAWKKVLRVTQQKRGCWNSEVQRLERRRLRVQAHLELGQFDECVHEAAGSNDPWIDTMVKLCKSELRAG